MRVCLSDGDQYEGGSLLHATPDKGFVAASRIAGHYTIHDWDNVHGVTSLTSGVRDMLFVVKSKAEQM